MWGKPEYPGKTTDFLRVTDKLYHITSYQIQFVTDENQTHNIRGDRYRGGMHKVTYKCKLKTNRQLDQSGTLIS